MDVGPERDERAWPFVGRGAEVEVGRALRGGRGVLIVGEGGVGRSRLAAELVAGTGGSWHHVGGSPGADRVALGAWSHLLPAMGIGALDDATSWRALAEHLTDPRGGIRLLVDDVHWFDPDSAALLHHLVVSHGATVVATSRSDVPAGPSITALWKDGHLTRLDLGPLAPTQLDAVLEAALGAPVEPRTVQRLHDRTGGNVLLTRQLIEDVRADGSLELAHGAWVERSRSEPSGRLVDLLAERIEALDPDERAGAEVVAVVAPVAAQLLDRAVPPPVVQRLLAGGWLSVATVGRHRVRLADPLTAEVLIARGRPGRREEVQLAMVGVYEQAEELDDRDTLRLAVWRVELGLAIDVVDAVRAADLALARSDPATAERLAAEAMAGGGGPGAAIRRGEALRQLQRHAEADATLAPVGDHLAELDDDLRFRFAPARALALGTEMGRLDEAVAVLETVIAAMDARPPRWRLEAHLSFLLADCGRIRAAAPLAEARLDRPEEDEPAALTALVAGAIVRTLGGRCQDTLDLCEAMTPVALRHLDDVPEAIGWVAAAQMFATYVRGEMHDAEALAATLEQLVVDHPDPSLRAAVLMYRGLILSDRGRLDAALRVLRQAAALHEVDNHRGYQAWVLAIMARTHAQRGDLGAAREALAAARRHRWPDGQVFDTDIEVAAVWVEALGGDRGRAEEVLAGALARAEAEDAPTLVMRLRHEAVRAGLPPGPHVGPLAHARTGQQSLWLAVHSDHVAGLVADDGVALVAVGRRYAALGIHLQAAEAHAQGAEAHRRAGSPTMAAQARELSMAQQALCEGAATPALRAGGPMGGLTGRELDVATRAAAGHTNQEIAAALGISVRTAETHLQRVFAKLGLHRRSDLATLFGPPT